MNTNNNKTIECSQNKKANSLINETSPYLLGHAYNPVNWYAWNKESLNKAKTENKPIFLSIGYSSCHWCHVMEDKCFENKEIATILNKHFISIKVDREERPDLDKIYMDFIQKLNGNGGWPLNVFLTPDLKPFFGGTYFPPDNFKNLLLQISTKWNSDFRTELINYADNYVNSIQNGIIIKDKDKRILNTEIFKTAELRIKKDFDKENGGFGDAPKFPSILALEFLLRRYYRTQNKDLLDFVLFSLTTMSERGIFDTIGGGFHRYSVDKQWKVPHFEKMLYDNASLANLLLETFKLSQDKFLKHTALKTLEFVKEKMTSPEGAFFSSINADDKHGEGMFYLWTHKEIIELLGNDTGELISLIYGITKDGNMTSSEEYHKGMNIFYMEKSLESIAKIKKTDSKSLQEKIDNALLILKKERAKRASPSIDDKIITSWNALMISTFADAYKVTLDEKYLDSANKACDFILNNLYKNEFLYRSFRKKRSRNKAYLDDYAFMIEALIDLYEASSNFNRIIIAKSLTDKMIELFWDKHNGGFYYSEKSDDIISSKKEFFDSSISSGNSSAVKSLIKLSHIFDIEEYKNKAKETIMNIAPYISQYPLSFSNMLLAADLYIYPLKEIVVSGKKELENTKFFKKTLYGNYLPDSIILFYDSQIKKPFINLPIFKGRESDNTLLFICKNNICQKPVYTREELLKQFNL